MEKEKITEALTKEQEWLAELQEKRVALDAKIKSKEVAIKKYEDMLRQKRFSEAEDVLYATGISLEDVLAAVAAGNVSSLQEKLMSKEERPHGEEKAAKQQAD